MKKQFSSVQDHRTYVTTMNSFQSDFSAALFSIFSSGEIVIAFLFGSVIRGVADFRKESHTDIDVFVCYENGISCEDEKIKRLREWYFEFHHKYGLEADTEWPGEIMSRYQLDEALYRQPDFTIQLSGNSPKILDTTAWAAMLREPSLPKLGKCADIRRYVELACYSDEWIYQLLNHLQNLPTVDCFQMLSKFYIPWAQNFVRHLESHHNLAYENKRGYWLEDVSPADLLRSIQNFSSYYKITSEHNPLQLRQFKKVRLLKSYNGIDLYNLSKVLANPGELIANTDPYYRVLFYHQGRRWLNQLLDDIHRNNPEDIACYVFRGIIDWFSFPDYE